MGRHKNTMYPKIFVKIPALDDSELTHTIEDAIKKAAYPERLVFSICLTYSQSVAKAELEAYLDKYAEICEFKVTIQTFHPDLLGVAKGRYITESMYEDEDYVLQIDAHTWFCDFWDEHLIRMLDKHDDKTIISGLLPPYEPKGRYPMGKGVYLAEFVDERTYCDWMPNWNPKEVKTDDEFFDNKFSAHFAFGTKEFGKYSGLNKSSFFWSEEPIQDFNLKSKGFKIISPNIQYPLLCHLYTDHIHDEHGKRATISNYLSEEEADYWMNVYDREVYESFFFGESISSL